MTATLTRRVEHSPALIAGSQGNVQVLPDGDWLIGWGQSPWFSEYGPQGQILFDAHLPSAYESYRTFRQAWSAQPDGAARASPTCARDEAAIVYASWNGATGVASWRVLDGQLAERDGSRRRRGPSSGFETAVTLADRRAVRAPTWRFRRSALRAPSWVRRARSASEGRALVRWRGPLVAGQLSDGPF